VSEIVPSDGSDLRQSTLAREALVLGVTKSPPILAEFAVAEDIVIKHSLVATINIEVVLLTRYHRRMK
jgi:hypothetical protein